MYGRGGALKKEKEAAFNTKKTVNVALYPEWSEISSKTSAPTCSFILFGGGGCFVFLSLLFSAHLTWGKLTTAQVETVQCTKQSTPVPVSTVPSAPLQIKFHQFCYIN
jgi:hypothetical protein